jgi:uncharacterized protein (DUF2252 family)
MASDMAAAPRIDLWVELCGDAHLGNFRWYHAPDRALVFDLNDFDETLPETTGSPRRSVARRPARRYGTIGSS